MDRRSATRATESPWGTATDWLRRHVPDLLAVIGHGAAGRGETLPGAPLEVTAVVRLAPPRADVEQAHRTVASLLPHEWLELTFVEAHRLGWLSPSLFQQSLLWGATLLWGDPAALRVIPSWRPEQLNPRLALDAVAIAEGDLGAGHHALAAANAAGALLLAKRRYAPRFDARAAALREAWPEAPVPPEQPTPAEATAFVATARRLVGDWLFTWEGDGPGPAAVRRFEELRRRSGDAQAPAAVA